MRAELYPVPECPSGRLAIMPRPRAGDWLEDEIASWRKQGLQTVVSLLQDVEIAELGLSDEQSLCEKAGVRFIRFPIPDRGVPAAFSAVSQLVGSLAATLSEGGSIGIHCRIGVGRSALIAVCVLTALGVSVESAWISVQRARGLSVPDTEEQRVWVPRWLTGFTASSKKPASE